MPERISPMSCQWVFGLGCLVSLAVGWWFVSGVFWGWMVLIAYSVAFGQRGKRDPIQ